MSDIAIRVEELSKVYKLGAREQYRTLRDSLTDAISAPFRRLSRAASKNEGETLWALKDVSFEVKQGEVIGIIGRNGAGKSTLLKILSRITDPSSGRILLHGRVGSLLEVGTGFHHELSGRENIFLNGAILGMKKAEILRKFDEIVAFSEVDRFIDTPVKHYSSGMYVRLAFAVAAHLEPDILIIDEVLAVGDTAFQQKCLGKMREVSKGGRTVLFVSHQLPAISALTQRCVLLESGRCVMAGATRDVVSHYVKSVATEELVYEAAPNRVTPKLVHASVKTSMAPGTHRMGDPMQFVFRIHTPVAVQQPTFSFQVFDDLKSPVLHSLVLDSETPLFRRPGTYELICEIPRCRLYLGEYTISTHIAGPADGDHYETVTDICPFTVDFPPQRDYPWRRGTSSYVEDVSWSARPVSAPETSVLLDDPDREFVGH